MSRLLAVLVAAACLCGCDVRTSVDLIFHRHGPQVVDEAHRVVAGPTPGCPHGESGGDPNAVSAGGGNHGAAQINDVHRDAFERVTHQPWSAIYDPWWNIYFAHWLYEQSGNSWRAWSCRP